jgi:hypothetical protein
MGENQPGYLRHFSHFNCGSPQLRWVINAEPGPQLKRTAPALSGGESERESESGNENVGFAQTQRSHSNVLDLVCAVD